MELFIDLPASRQEGRNCKMARFPRTEQEVIALAHTRTGQTAGSSEAERRLGIFRLESTGRWRYAKGIEMQQIIQVK